MPLTAIRYVRKMRGGAQAHLLEADDSHWYVVKFRHNPQHRRVLVNEVRSAELLSYLKISAPPTALIQVTREFVAANPKCCLQMGTRRIDVEPGWQFGSRYPGDPARLAVYDFLPDALLSQVANLSDFRAVLVFDKWTGNADGRQCVFYRAMIRGDGLGSGHAGFVVRDDRPRVRVQRAELGLSGIALTGTIRAEGSLRWRERAGRFSAVAGPGGLFPGGGDRSCLEKASHRNGLKVKRTLSSGCWNACGSAGN